MDPHLSTYGCPRLAYGLWRYREDEVDTALRLLAQAREGGIDHLDVADVYGGRGNFGGAERLLGQVRRASPSVFEGCVVATKAGIQFGTPYCSSRDFLTARCEESLMRLGVEQIDLFYVHRPDFLTHPAELGRTLDDLVSSGKVAAVAVSNFTTHQLDALARSMTSPILAHQIELSAAHVAPILDGVLDQAMAMDMAVVAWSPLAGGRLGAAAGDDSHGLHRICVAIDEVAAKTGAPFAAVALAFLLRHPAAITPIVGTKDPARLTDCLRAPSLELQNTDWYAILQASLPRPLP